MIFAAGLGTRLRPLTNERPKPGVPVGLLPLVSHTLEKLAKSGLVTRFVFNTHHLGEALEPLLAPHIPSHIETRFVHEPKLLGTAGGLRNAMSVLESDDILIVNGDILYSPPFESIVRFHRHQEALATLVVRDDASVFEKGAIEFDPSNRIRRMLTKAPDANPSWYAAMFTGVHIVKRSAVAELPEEGCIVRQGYVPWLARGEKIMAHVDNSAWRDLGTLQEYLAGNVEHAARSVNHGHDSLVAQNVSLGENVHLSQCVVGEGATVANNVKLERVVVWPNANVTQSLKNAVVTTTQIVNVVDETTP